MTSDIPQRAGRVRLGATVSQIVRRGQKTRLGTVASGAQRGARAAPRGAGHGLASVAGHGLASVAGVLALSICVLAVGTQCGRRETGITFMAGGEPNEVAYWETLIDEFESRSGIQVRLIRQPADSDQRREQLAVPLRSGEPDPDVFLMDVVWVAQLAASGWLEPLDGYVTGGDFSLDPFFAGIVDLADRYRGTLYALPVYVDGGLLYYRTDLLAEYGLPGPPRTWDELLAYSLKVQEGERIRNENFYGFVWQGSQYEGLVCNFLEFAASSEAWTDTTGEGYRFDGPASAEALRFMRDLIQVHGISPPNTYTEMKEEQCRIVFQRGDALFERNWPYAWVLHERADSPVRGRVGIAPLPHFRGGRSVSALGGWHVGISRSSDSSQQSWRFAKFITSYEAQKGLALNLGWNPARVDIYEDRDVIESIPHLGLLRGIFESAVPRPRVPYYSQVSDMLQRNLNACLSGRVDENEALAAIGREAERLRKRYDEAR